MRFFYSLSILKMTFLSCCEFCSLIYWAYCNVKTMETTKRASTLIGRSYDAMKKKINCNKNAIYFSFLPLNPLSFCFCQENSKIKWLNFIYLNIYSSSLSPYICSKFAVLSRSLSSYFHRIIFFLCVGIYFIH